MKRQGRHCVQGLIYKLRWCGSAMSSGASLEVLDMRRITRLELDCQVANVVGSSHVDHGGYYNYCLGV